MENRFGKYLLFGLLFIGFQTFWVSVIWRNDITGFILELVITDVLFLIVNYFAGIILDKFIPRKGLSDLLIYFFAAFLGLVVIEWIFVGNFPGETEASQFVMFTTWGGAAFFARMFSYKSSNLIKIRKYTFLFFVTFAGIATVLGLLFLAVNPKTSFVITYYAATVGYPLMVPFFIWYAMKKIVSKSSVSSL